MKQSIGKSIESALALAVAVTKADASAYYPFGYAPSDGSILFADGSRITVPVSLELSASSFTTLLISDSLVVVRDLKLEDGRATIAFRFSDPELFRQPKTLASLNHAHRVLEALVCRKEDLRAQSRLAEKAIALEWELFEEKVQAHVSGLLTATNPDDTGLQALENQVKASSRSLTIKTLLSERLHALETRLAEQSIVARAKDLMRNKIGISEEQAHAQLRLLSRRNRKRIGEIAESFLANSDASSEVSDVHNRAHG